MNVTDRLVREFSPDEKRLKAIEEIKKQKAVPLDQIDRMKDNDSLYLWAFSGRMIGNADYRQCSGGSG